MRHKYQDHKTQKIQNKQYNRKQNQKFYQRNVESKSIQVIQLLKLETTPQKFKQKCLFNIRMLRF